MRGELGDFEERPRLLDKLNQGLQQNDTLITAPAYFGKTSLVMSGVSQITAEDWSIMKGRRWCHFNHGWLHFRINTSAGISWRVSRNKFI